MERVNLKNKRMVQIYSESFKQKILQEVSEGKLTKVQEPREKTREPRIKTECVQKKSNLRNTRLKTVD